MGNVQLHLAGHFYFFGGLLTFLCVFQIVGLFFFRADHGTWADNVWAFCAVIAFWLALGDDGILWECLSHLPMIGFVTSLSHAHHAVRGHLRLPCRRPGAGAVAQKSAAYARRIIFFLPGFCSWLWHVYNCQFAFYTYNFKPYPEMPPKLHELLFDKNDESRPTGRVASWAHKRSGDPNYGLADASRSPGRVSPADLRRLQSAVQR